jgi:hypothetical protein
VSHSKVALTDPAYPPLSLDLYETAPTVNGQQVKINVGVVDATRLSGAQALTAGQVAQIVVDVHSDMP